MRKIEGEGRSIFSEIAQEVHGINGTILITLLKILLIRSIHLFTIFKSDYTVKLSKRTQTQQIENNMYIRYYIYIHKKTILIRFSLFWILFSMIDRYMGEK